MAYFYRVICLVLVLISTSANALIPLVPKYFAKVAYTTDMSASTPDGACTLAYNGYIAALGGYGPYGPSGWVARYGLGAPVGTFCGAQSGSSPGVVSVTSGNNTSQSGTMCPVNSSPSGASCACNSGYSENAGHTACISNNTCVGGLTENFSFELGFAAVGSYPYKRAPDSVCSPAGGSTSICQWTIGGGIATAYGPVVNGQQAWIGQNPGTSTATPCAPGTSQWTPETPPTPPPCAGQSGMLNGVSVCLPTESLADKTARAASAAAAAASAASAAALAGGASASVAASAAAAAGTATSLVVMSGGSSASAAAAGMAAGSSKVSAASSAASSSASAAATAAAAGKAAGDAAAAASLAAGGDSATQAAAAAAASAAATTASLAASNAALAAAGTASAAAAAAAAAATAAAQAAGLSAAQITAASTAASAAAALAVQNAAAAGASLAAQMAAAKAAGDAAGAASAQGQSDAVVASAGSAAGAGAAAGAGSGAAAGDGVSDISKFCRDNPKAAMCKESMDSKITIGPCGSPPPCEGDAIFCAIASQTFKTACAFSAEGDLTAEEQKFLDDKGLTGDQTENLPNNDAVTISSSSFDQSEFLGAGVGFSDATFTVAGQQFTLPLSNINIWLSRLGVVLQAVTFLLCLRIVSRG